ncbi:MAG: ParB/RepB/Spo0J family partition protein [Oligoflexia bacterium]|nr:ParB/RepB/Spo0J family partition protein [Oligoflexia bacterium]
MAESKEPQKRSLGRGLSSLFGDDVVDEFRSTPPGTPLVAPLSAPIKQALTAEFADNIPDNQRVWQIDIEKLAANVYQPRKQFVSEKIQELAASIKEKGILQPIVARKIGQDQFEIIAGERRWRAAQLAGLQKVPVILKEVQNQESLELALIENLQRHDLNPIEEGEAFQQLCDEFGLSQQEVAQKVGKDRATVANTLRLLGLSPEVKQMLAQGEISAGHAKALLALTDPIKQRELAKKITSEKLTVRAAEKLVQTATKRSANAQGLEVNVAAKLVKGLQDDLAKTLGTKVEIAYNKGQGTISVKFYSDEDLTRIIERIKR